SGSTGPIPDPATRPPGRSCWRFYGFPKTSNASVYRVCLRLVLKRGLARTGQRTLIGAAGCVKDGPGHCQDGDGVQQRWSFKRSQIDVVSFPAGATCADVARQRPSTPLGANLETGPPVHADLDDAPHFARAPTTAQLHHRFAAGHIETIGDIPLDAAQEQ